jgi:putative salt-induced outer membrane protein YdiY
MRTVCLVILASLAIPGGTHFCRGEESEPDIPEFPIGPSQLVVDAPPPKPKSPWCGGLEAGGNGTNGNSETLKLRVGTLLKYESDSSFFKLDLLYAYANANSRETENRGSAESRREWLFANSPWSVFVSGSLWYDAFTAYDLRIAAHAGVGYQFVKTESLLLKGRLGAGAAREIRGPENRWTPEGLLGLDWEWKLSQRQRFTSASEVFPDLQELGQYRAQVKVAYEILVDPRWNLTLKLGVLDRYDSTPEGKKRNDLEYFAVLLWRFGGKLDRERLTGLKYSWDK